MSRAYGWQPDGKTIEPAEADEIRRWATYLLDQDTDPPPSLRGLAADLKARGVATVSGAQWNPTVIRRSLVAPRMIGRRVDDTGDLVDSDIEPILDEDTWTALREQLLHPDRQKFAPTRTNVYLMSEGLARCALCAHHLTYNTAGGRTPYYGCSLAGGGCGKVTISAPLLEADITERVLARLTDPKYRRKLGKAMAATGTVADAEAVLADLRERYAVLGRDYADRLIQRDTMLAGTERARANIAAAERKILQLQALDDMPGPSVDEVLAWWEAALADRQHRIVAALLNHVVVRSSEGRSVIGADRLELHWHTFK
ncbi:recombinase zinc beta ribbon domain-containing protein [Nocardia amamiensis]|uniref:Recombinase zinc beta ribbon domain-containing protein n=1 Tax=Nocardia amamiensis TaxID=404578 RepID=A0ABS0CTN3_9NOCA|nr:recombinase zinc beta ribbon domain-containing protein [Nocardia amamiensis]MBF6298199.1 recombinase zinc beta ribbon domain-containing protein [Nocardia amamiensis]